jgi:hypothetical protein
MVSRRVSGPPERPMAARPSSVVSPATAFGCPTRARGAPPVYYVLALSGRPILLALHETEDAARLDFGTLSCPSVIARVDDDAVHVVDTREIEAEQIDGPFLEAVKRVCRRVPAAT